MLGVSVIIPAYNCGRYLDESIQSVLKQSHKDLELIVVNNASDDNTDEVLGKYASDSRLKYEKINKKNVSAARNLGIKMACNSVIAFLDADDMFFKYKLEKQVIFMEKHPMCAVSYTSELYFKEGSQKEALSTYYHFSGDIFYYLKRNDFIHTSTFMARKNALPVAPFDEKLTSHEDWDLFLRLARNGVKFAYLDEPLSRIRVRKESATFQGAVMDRTRREVGLRAREYWKSFKTEMNVTSLKGWRAIARYLKFKIGAALLGFPKNARFTRPVPQEML